MMLFQQIVLAINVLLALVFGVDYFVVESRKAEPKTKAKMGVVLAVLFLLFLSSLSLFMVLSALFKRNACYLALSVFVIIPFVIGRLASYRTLKFYAAVQFLAFLFSAVILYLV